MNKTEAEEWLKSTVSDMFMDMCYYDRKEDEQMNIEQLRTIMDNDIISKEKMIEIFVKQIEQEYETD